MKTHLQILIRRSLGQIYTTEEHGPTRNMESRLECYIRVSMSPKYKPNQCNLIYFILDHSVLLYPVILLLKSET